VSRYNPNHHVEPVYSAVRQWRKKCLIADHSVFSEGKNLWTSPLLDELDQRFVKNLDAGEGDFLSKLKVQLSEGSPDCLQLMAEIVWLLLLFPSKVGAAKKRENVLEIWSWSGKDLNATHPLLEDAVLEGIGSAGTAFNTQRWRELVFLIGALRDFKARDASDRAQIASDPWAFSSWLSGLPEARHRQLIHILPHLLFPDTFERISSEGDKRLILAGFGDTPEKELRKWGTVEIDRALFDLRRRLEDQHGADFDFYQEEFEAKWKAEAKNRLLSSNSVPDELEVDEGSPLPARRVWIEKSLVKARPDRQTGPHRLGEALWSPQRAKNGGDLYANMRRVQPGDIVLHLTDNEGFTGVSQAAEPVDDTFTGVAGTAWGDQPGYRIQLREFHQLDPILPREAFLEDTEIGKLLQALLQGRDGRGLFYNRDLQLNQGAYLSEARPSLVAILNRAYEKIAGRKLIDLPNVPLAPVSASPTVTMTLALNTIFYGPPGTGKTFITARRAVEICDGGFVGDDAKVRARYDELVKQRRIEFVTFHQSYGYEEFVEGLRPDTGANDDGQTGPGFRLVPVDGVLKRIADRARKLPSISNEPFDPSGRKVWKVSLGRSSDAEDDYLRQECLDNGYILLGYGGDVDWSDDRYSTWQAIADKWRSLPGEANTDSKHGHIVFTAQLRANMGIGDIVLASRGTRMIQAIGVVTGPYEFVRRESDEYHHRRRVKWFWKDETGAGIPVGDVYDKNFMQHSIYLIDPKRVKWDALMPYLRASSEVGNPLPHVLIIDEINRANISKVMGELITLLEEDKREGRVNELVVTLPHSGQQFALPPHLHIIGTMNTADRSIALLDTALRRRFQFVEMPPEPNKLNSIDGIDAAAVLASINDRLEWFLGPDQLIGHAWLMGAKGRSDLDAAMAKKIIPLLREYFHEDLSRVRAVLGGGDGFLRRVKIETPPGVDDFGEERYRYVDVYQVDGTYAPDAYNEAIGGVQQNQVE
jgi:hypothetical protein